jgi:RNA polymerase sigma-70 factor (ECF subfamily)
MTDVDDELPVKNDATLLREARSDARAFRTFFERYAEGVYGFHVRRTHDPDAAHDLTAETFSQAWLSRTRFRDESGGTAGPWLYGIARHVLLASVRRQRLERSARERLGLFEHLDREPATTEPADSWLDGLDEAFDDLPEGQRLAIQLRVLANLDYEHVADELGTTSRAARVRVARGLATLRKKFTKPMEATK